MVDFTEETSSEPSPADVEDRSRFHEADDESSFDSLTSGSHHIDVYGSSMPNPNFLNSLAQRHGRTYVSGSPFIRESFESFATAYSTLASYATAPSGPRHIWDRELQHRRNTLTSDYPQKTVTNEGQLFDLLVTTVSREIWEFISTQLPVPILVSDFSTSQIAIRRHLLPLCRRKAPHEANPSNVNPVQTAISKVMTKVENVRNDKVVSDTVRELVSKSDLQYQITCRIYEFVALQTHLCHLVPEHYLRTPQVFGSEWLCYLADQGIIDSDELNWSGRGQHVEFEAKNEDEIPLVPKGILGHGATGVVERVKCRRIMLARKSIRTNRRLTKEEAITEVQHLQGLWNRHVVRLVSTYTLGRMLAILIYPAAQKSLEDHLIDLAQPKKVEIPPGRDRLKQLDPCMTYRFIGCLSGAIKYLHEKNIKHMDIKPSNILVTARTVYIADFGIARAHSSAKESYTDSPTSFTPVYAAPEVAAQSTRGFPADIFSLGCVFMEIIAACLSTAGYDGWERLLHTREQSQDTSYHANIEAAIEWYEPLLRDKSKSWVTRWGHMIPSMLQRNPAQRPSARELWMATEKLRCANCDQGPEPFVAVKE